MKLQTNYDVDFYLLLVDKEDSHYAYLAKEYIIERFNKAKIFIIKDVEGRGRSKKYNKFLEDIHPLKSEIINDMGKFIVLNKEGQVLKITSYKDFKKDEHTKEKLFGVQPMFEREIAPLLKRK